DRKGRFGDKAGAGWIYLFVNFCSRFVVSCKPFQRGRCDAFPDVVFLSRSDECSDDHRNCLLSARKKEVVLIWLSTVPSSPSPFIWSPCWSSGSSRTG